VVRRKLNAQLDLCDNNSRKANASQHPHDRNRSNDA
jgi:hypothetical protein